jgi:hypothetical protein
VHATTTPPVTEVLMRLGGVAPRGHLLAVCGRAAVDAALSDGRLVAVTRGVYCSAVTDASLAAAAGVSGVLSHRSAALAHGWAVRTVPDRPDVTLPRNRRIAAARVAGLSVHRADLGPDDARDRCTSPGRTLVDCLRSLPFVEALAVADSALRSGVAPQHLAALARDARGPGAVAVRRVADLADGRAANPFESTLRAICLEVEGLEVTPQVTVRAPHRLGTPDLVDVRLELALEADSFEWHGDRAALHRDANHYNAFVAAGWLVLRFSWEEVMFHPERVRAVLEAVVARRSRDCSCGAAA